MTAVCPAPAKTRGSLSPSGDNSLCRANSVLGQILARLSQADWDRQEDEVLSRRPYESRAQQIGISLPPINYEQAEASLRQYVESHGGDFNDLVSRAAANAPAQITPWAGEITDAEIDDLVLDDDDAVGGEMP